MPKLTVTVIVSFVIAALLAIVSVVAFLDKVIPETLLQAIITAVLTFLSSGVLLVHSLQEVHRKLENKKRE